MMSRLFNELLSQLWLVVSTYNYKLNQLQNRRVEVAGMADRIEGENVEANLGLGEKLELIMAVLQLVCLHVGLHVLVEFGERLWIVKSEREKSLNTSNERRIKGNLPYATLARNDIFLQSKQIALAHRAKHLSLVLA